MKNLFLFTLLILGSLAIRIESAPASRTVAILPFSEEKNPVMSASDKQQLLETIRGIARRSLPKAEGWKVISSEVVATKVGADLSTCNGEEACLLSAGHKLPADYIVSADVGRIGSYIEVSFSLFNVASGQVIGSEWPRGKTVDDIIDSLESSPDRLFANLSGADVAHYPNTPPINSQSGEAQNAEVQPSQQAVPDTQVIYQQSDPVIVEPYYYGSPYYYWDGGAWIYWGGPGYYHGGGYHGGYHGGHGGGGFHGRR